MRLRPASLAEWYMPISTSCELFVKQKTQKPLKNQDHFKDQDKCILSPSKSVFIHVCNNTSTMFILVFQKKSTVLGEITKVLMQEIYNSNGLVIFSLGAG